jgi:acetyl-CoA carboxylase biotin carboxylase subunit
MPSITSVFVANRGEIAVRVIRTCRKLGVRTVLGTSDVDRGSLAAELADRVIVIGPARNSYLNLGAVMAAAVASQVDALHPGYGFLAENPLLSRACDEAGIVYLGPTGQTIEALGNKLTARDLAARAGVPLLPGSERVDSLDSAQREGARIGFPLLVKAAAGGGGRGMRIVEETSDLEAALESATAEAGAAFGDSTLYLERYVADALHIEIQLVGDAAGRVTSVGDRDCSIQRRHQKLIEEAPAWRVPEPMRESMASAAVTLATSAAYRGLGTAEFLYDRGRDAFYFLEVNSRIQARPGGASTSSGYRSLSGRARPGAAERPPQHRAPDQC